MDALVVVIVYLSVNRFGQLSFVFQPADIPELELELRIERFLIRILPRAGTHLVLSMLTKAGYRLDIVENGKEVVEKYISAPERYDLIFMDIQMPEMGGREAARMIRDKGFDNVPIIAMTAASMKGDHEKCLEAGMNDYIPKPIKREVVFKIIKKWVLKS